MNKPLLLIVCALLASQAHDAAAQTAPSAKAEIATDKASVKKKSTATKKASGAAAAGAAGTAAASATDDDEQEPDIAGTTVTDYDCELGNKVTIYTNTADEKHIAMRWKKRLMRMTRVDTTTGANRFENRRLGMVWLGIPAKGILLDSKKGQQLANECRSSEQRTTTMPAPAGAPAPNQLLPQT